MGEIEAASAQSAAARALMQDRIEGFESACLTGTRSEITAYGVGVIHASAGLLVALEAQAEAILKFWGLDPTTRPQ